MKSIDELAQLMAELFTGRNGSSAIRIMIDGEKTYVPYRDREGNDIPLSQETCKKHLLGEISLGAYPIDQDDMVKWASVDFDGKRGNAMNDAKAVLEALQMKHGIVGWLERSQSGNGVHLWTFFDKKVPAAKVRAVFSECIPEFDTADDKRTTSYDRMFPNQDSARGGYGNLCALPLNGPELVKQGKTAFLEDDGQAHEKQSVMLERINNLINKGEMIDAIASKLKKPKPKKSLPVLNTIPGGTKLLAPQGCAWLRKAFKNAENLSEPEWYAALGQFAKVEQGDVLAHRFSEPYPDYDANKTQKKFEHALQEDKPMTCETIWEKFGDCGKRCAHLGVKAPWQIAQVSLSKLDESNKGKIHTGADVAKVSIDIIKEIASGKRLGYPWGYDLLDDHTELRPRNLIVAAARPGRGKTALAIDSSVLGAMRGIPQYFFSIEMSHEEVGIRYLARLAEVDHSQLITGKLGKEEWKKLTLAEATLKELPIFIDDTTREFDRQLDNAGELVYKNGKGVIWIDYLQLVRRKPGEDKKQAVDRFVDGYKQMSKILDCPVVALAQLGRGEETDEAEEELDSWLKDSGDIEQTADVILYIRGNKGPGTIERKLRIHKERHRASGVNLRFMFHQGIFKYESAGYWNKRITTPDETEEQSEGTGESLF